MFQEKKIILTISKKTISLSEVIVSQPAAIRPMAAYPFTDKSLVEVFAAIKKSVSSPIRIVLGEEYAYVVSLMPASVDKDIQRNETKEKAQERIPEDLNSTTWDYKEIFIQDPKKPELKREFIQVVAAAQLLYPKISDAITGSGINVEAVEPMSFSLARLTENQTDPHIIIHIGESMLFIACWKGVVLATENVKVISDSSAFHDFVRYVEDSYKIKLTTIIVSGKLTQEEITKLDFHGFNVGAQNLDPRMGLAIKRDIHGEDERVLNIVFQKNSSSQDADSTPKKERNVRNIALLSMLVVSSFVLLTTVFVRRKSTIRSTASPRPTLQISTQAVEMNYSISVLNGGLDTSSEIRLLSSLESQGFIISRVAETEGKDYVNVTISLKQPLQEEAKNRLDNILKSYYSELLVQTASSTQEADIEIILGRNK